MHFKQIINIFANKAYFYQNYLSKLYMITNEKCVV
jgi:hypothetical protein